jgi:hypothetical protein
MCGSRFYFVKLTEQLRKAQVRYRYPTKTQIRHLSSLQNNVGPCHLKLKLIFIFKFTPYCCYRYSVGSNTYRYQGFGEEVTKLYLNPEFRIRWIRVDWPP